MPGRQKSDEKRDEILAAAEKEFARRDFHLVLMDDVAARAGVGKGTLYRYFPTKDELLPGNRPARARRVARRLHARLRRGRADREDPGDRRRAHARLLLGPGTAAT